MAAGRILSKGSNYALEIRMAEIPNCFEVEVSTENLE
jgi:hypothetical protein